MLNEALLRETIEAKGLTLSEVATALNINPSTLWRKLTGVSDFTRSDIVQIVDVLKLNSAETFAIFFA